MTRDRGKYLRYLFHRNKHTTSIVKRATWQKAMNTPTHYKIAQLKLNKSATPHQKRSYTSLTKRGNPTPLTTRQRKTCPQAAQPWQAEVRLLESQEYQLLHLFFHHITGNAKSFALLTRFRQNLIAVATPKQDTWNNPLIVLNRHLHYTASRETKQTPPVSTIPNILHRMKVRTQKIVIYRSLDALPNHVVTIGRHRLVYSLKIYQKTHGYSPTLPSWSLQETKTYPLNNLLILPNKEITARNHVRVNPLAYPLRVEAKTKPFLSHYYLQKKLLIAIRLKSKMKPINRRKIVRVTYRHSPTKSSVRNLLHLTALFGHANRYATLERHLLISKQNWVKRNRPLTFTKSPIVKDTRRRHLYFLQSTRNRPSKNLANAVGNTFLLLACLLTAWKKQFVLSRQRRHASPLLSLKLEERDLTPYRWITRPLPTFGGTLSLKYKLPFAYTELGKISRLPSIAPPLKIVPKRKLLGRRKTNANLLRCPLLIAS